MKFTNISLLIYFRFIDFTVATRGLDQEILQQIKNEIRALDELPLEVKNNMRVQIASRIAKTNNRHNQ